VIVCVFAAQAAGAADAKPDQVVIGYQAFPTAELVAKDQKWLEKELGIPVKWVLLTSGMQGLDPLSEGKIDLALLGSSPAAAGISKGVPLQVIWIHDIIGENEALVATQKSGIKAVSDLVGKRVAAPFGSTTHYHLNIALMLDRIKAKDVKIQFLEPGEIEAAWGKGEIDAAFIWHPTLRSLARQDGTVIVTSMDLTERGFPVADLGVVRTDFGQKYPDVVLAYLKTLDRAVKYCRANKAEAVAAIARQLDISESEANLQMDGLIVMTAQEQNHGQHFGGLHWNFSMYTLIKEKADFLLKAGVVDKIPPREAFMEGVNASFLTQAAEE
jgi:taurine transport system substrate-binding protein